MANSLEVPPDFSNVDLNNEDDDELQWRRSDEGEGLTSVEEVDEDDGAAGASGESMLGLNL